MPQKASPGSIFAPQLRQKLAAGAVTACGWTVATWEGRCRLEKTASATTTRTTTATAPSTRGEDKLSAAGRFASERSVAKDALKSLVSREYVGVPGWREAYPSALETLTL